MTITVERVLGHYPAVETVIEEEMFLDGDLAATLESAGFRENWIENRPNEWHAYRQGQLCRIAKVAP